MNELREKLQQKRKSGKGFTLMEMLIVVAIIAILVAIAIPTFNASLEKARKATDQANARALKSLCVTEYLMDNSNTGTYGLDASAGVAVKASGTADGKATFSNANVYKVQSSTNKGDYITCTIGESGGEMTVTMYPSDILNTVSN